MIRLHWQVIYWLWLMLSLQRLSRSRAYSLELSRVFKIGQSRIPECQRAPLPRRKMISVLATSWVNFRFAQKDIGYILGPETLRFYSQWHHYHFRLLREHIVKPQKKEAGFGEVLSLLHELSNQELARAHVASLKILQGNFWFSSKRLG